MADDAAERVIDLRGIRFWYGSTGSFGLVIDELEIDRGARVACIGPSGTGKTTLVNLIAGILAPDAGRVSVLGTCVSDLPDKGRRAFRIEHIGMVFQEFELLDYLTAQENILLPYHVAGHLVLDAAVRERGEHVARSMGIAEVLSRRPSRLSQGERQRVAICRALVTEPELLMCDEPTGNLDPTTAERTLDLLFQHVHDENATLLMVTHNHGILERFDRVIDVAEWAELAS